MRVPRLRRRESEVARTDVGPFTLGRAPIPGFTLENFEVVETGGDTVLIRVSGEWSGGAPEFSTLAVRTEGRTKHFQSLPAGPAGGEASAGLWRAGFAVASSIIAPSSRYALSAHGTWVPLMEPGPAAGGQDRAEDAAGARTERDAALAEMTAAREARERRALEH